jgi:hypothetical protein|eukprot:gene15170-10857_t
MGLKRKFSEDETEATSAPEAAEPVKAKKELPAGYVCNACGAVGQHAIYECPQKVSKKKAKKAAAGESETKDSTAEPTVAAATPAASSSSEAAASTADSQADPAAPAIKTIFLSGLPFDITKDKLLKAIESISDSVCNLSLRNITLLCFQDNPNRCRGIGYINCEHDDDFQRCLQLQGMTIGKMTISAQESKLPAKQPHHQAVAGMGPNGGKGPSAHAKKAKGPPRCYRCGQMHDPATCSNERICYKCRQPGHLSSQCPVKKPKNA